MSWFYAKITDQKIFINPFQAIALFNTTSKHLMFSRGIKRGQWHKIGQFVILNNLFKNIYQNILFVTFYQNEFIISPRGSKKHKGHQLFCKSFDQELSPFRSTSLFYTSYKHQKTKGFSLFSGGIKRKHWPEKG